uniref:ribosomal protein S7 n=1 Tax=Gayralia brasiliensis TaxID=1286870 RepID=UPI002410DDC7|nr:ribosomal protein S7 [Gayralia brasiliensis]YP_010733747.1 ribosomal protein S7 [Monostroma nitidum]WEG92944.1 ribosomal protein S7 [Gayralia brasiliensis]WEG93018.1 ribosomal protein S7 [Monostroma nitidum]
MSRRRRAKKRMVSPDSIYDSRLINMLVNRVMKDGKKSLAYKIVYQTMEQIAEKTEQDAMKILEQAIRNTKPLVEVKARRVGGSAYQVPLEVNAERGTVLALQWILTAARNRSGRSSISKLTNELIDASKKTGGAIKKRDEVHRMAEANKAFAKFRF